jgi:hypothetical protein
MEIDFVELILVLPIWLLLHKTATHHNGLHQMEFEGQRIQKDISGKEDL